MTELRPGFTPLPDRPPRDDDREPSWLTKLAKLVFSILNKKREDEGKPRW